MNLRLVKQSYVADPDLGFPRKSILQLFDLTSQFRQRVS